MEMRIPFINNTFQQKKTRMLPQDLIKPQLNMGGNAAGSRTSTVPKEIPAKPGVRPVLNHTSLSPI
jgi:hypothetical protein